MLQPDAQVLVRKEPGLPVWLPQELPVLPQPFSLPASLLPVFLLRPSLLPVF